MRFTTRMKTQIPTEGLQPRIVIEHTPDGACVQLRGCWTAEHLAERANWAAVQAGLQTAQRSGPAVASWDVRAVQRLDHTAAQLLWNSWGRQWPATLHAEPAQRAVLERVARYPAVALARRRNWAAQAFLRTGAGVFQVGGHVSAALRLLGQLLLDVLRLMRAPRAAPWRDVSGHLYRIGATALPITALVGFLIGVVLAYLMSRQLRQFGADTFIVNILGISLIRELGPVLAAILIAGRSGSAITAQIGVMRVTEEIDAMRVMGIATGYRLVMPRVIAMVLAMPLLAVWTTLAALLGGMLASDVAMGLTPGYFITALSRAVEISNLWLAIGKSAVFGLLIALIGCHYGLRVKPNTQSLGEGTTASVVTSITMVLLVDAGFAILFKDIGI